MNELETLKAENAALKERNALLERAHGGLAERWRDTQREVGMMRQVASRDDGKLLELSRRILAGPVDEAAVEAWFNEQGFEDAMRDAPFVLHWNGLHTWHQEFIVKAAQHFGGVPSK